METDAPLSLRHDDPKVGVRSSLPAHLTSRTDCPPAVSRTSETPPPARPSGTHLYPKPENHPKTDQDSHGGSRLRRRYASNQGGSEPL